MCWPVFGLIESSSASSKRPATNGSGIARQSVCHSPVHGSFGEAMNV